MTRAIPHQKKRQYLPATERRRRILESSRAVFAQSGLRGSRTRELAQAAGVNQATLFEHFSSKEELFMQAVVEPLVELMAGARKRAGHYAQADSPEVFSRRLEQAVGEHLGSVADSFPLLVQALFSDQTLGSKLYCEHIAPALEAQAEVMKDFVADDLEPRLVQLASFGMFFAVAMDSAMTGRTVDQQCVARQLSRMLAHGGTTLVKDTT
ncbi:TetR/AcrR family transcriptional regulator [Litorivivens sp.]|uniref:TetR/AcrR family transcriptional regulator n=1 Tax=Litorivivens sp. TaxID=2020868 RepID=UPI00356B2CFC